MKKLIMIAIVILVVAGGVFAIQQATQTTTTKGAKEVTFIVMDPENPEKEWKREVVHTDAEYVKQALEESSLNVETESGAYGDFIVSIAGVKQSSNTGWVYNSDTNEMCKADFCQGISNNTVQDQDVFVFELISF